MNDTEAPFLKVEGLRKRCGRLLSSPLFFRGLAIFFWALVLAGGYVIWAFQWPMEREDAVGKSPEEFLQAIHADMPKRMPSHGTGIAMCRHASVTSVEPIINAIRQGEEFQHCAGSHLDSILEQVTAHAPPESIKNDPDAARQFWLDWWEANAGKSQREWVKAGLARHGLNVDTPLTVTQAARLFERVGKMKIEADAKRDAENSAGGRNRRSARVASNLPHPFLHMMLWLRDAGGVTAIREMATLRNPPPGEIPSAEHQATVKALQESDSRMVDSGVQLFSDWLPASSGYSKLSDEVVKYHPDAYSGETEQNMQARLIYASMAICLVAAGFCMGRAKIRVASDAGR